MDDIREKTKRILFFRIFFFSNQRSVKRPDLKSNSLLIENIGRVHSIY